MKLKKLKTWLKYGLIGAISGSALALFFTIEDIIKKNPEICAFNKCPSFCPCKIGMPWLDPLVFQIITMFTVFIIVGFTLGSIIGKIKSKKKK